MFSYSIFHPSGKYCMLKPLNCFSLNCQHMSHQLWTASEHNTTSTKSTCPVKRFSHQSSGSLEILQIPWASWLMFWLMLSLPNLERLAVTQYSFYFCMMDRTVRCSILGILFCSQKLPLTLSQLNAIMLVQKCSLANLWGLHRMTVFIQRQN